VPDCKKATINAEIATIKNGKKAWIVSYKIKDTLISETDIAKRITELAREIETDFNHEPIVLIIVLKGSFIFAADLIREMKGDITVDFISISSYSDQTETTGKVKLLKDLDANITNQNVVVIEDIIDSGLTLHFLRDHLQLHKPKQIKLCTLLDKPERRRVEMDVDYVGFVIPDEFIVGYGIDYAQRYRNLPYIATVEAE
jgi:hypoxanthine phosphoribosyltransferase